MRFRINGLTVGDATPARCGYALARPKGTVYH
jgi:hypothetical protein